MNTNINLLWSSIKHTFDSAMELVPSKFTSSRYSQPCVTVTCKRLSRRTKRAYNRAKRTQLKDDWGIFQALTKETRKQCARAYNKFIRDSICPNIRNNAKKFFSFIKSRKMEHVGVSPLRDSLGRIQTEDKKKAIILNDQFASLLSKEDDITPHLSSPICTSMPDTIVTLEGVKKLLLLTPNKSTGPDLISARFLKEVATEIAPAITLLFNVSLNQGAIPTEWKEAYIRFHLRSWKERSRNPRILSSNFPNTCYE